MNKVIFMGRLSTEPETRYTQDGKPVVRFNFAVNRKFRRENEPDADFFTCVVFGKTAEGFSKCDIAKGTKLILSGEMRNNNYTDKNGVKRYENQLYVNDFEFCESKGAAGSAGPSRPVQEPPRGNDVGEGFMNIPDNLEDAGLPWA